MTLIQDNPSSALQEKKEGQGLISIQSLITCPEEEDIFEYSPMSLQENSNDPQISPSSQVILEQVAMKLKRHNSCESVSSLDESEASTSSGGEECPDESSNSSSCSRNSSSEDSHDEVSKEDEDSSEVRCDRSSSVVSDASEEGGRDSGIEAEKELDMVIPDESLMDKISAQVEFYFSDANVVKDKFLLKHIRRNKEGYVSLKLVSSFKKVKQLTKDWRVVAFSLSKVSDLIRINEQGTKIRRIHPLPDIDDSPITCAVLALDLPLEKPSVESVSKIFGTVGDIAFVRVLKAGGTLPPDVKSLLTKYPMLGEKQCAWIEFETPEAAKLAVSMNEEEGMKVVLIVPESQKKQEKLNQQKQQSVSRKNSGNLFRNNNSPNIRSSNSRKNSYNNNFSRLRKDSNQDYDVRRPAQRRKAISLPSAQNPFLSDPSMMGKYNPSRIRPKSKSCTEFPSAGSPPTSWVQRHLLAAAAASAASAASPTIGSRPPSVRMSRVSLGSLPLADGVVRFPKGPDGTKGFCRQTRLRQINEIST